MAHRVGANFKDGMRYPVRIFTLWQDGKKVVTGSFETCDKASQDLTGALRMSYQLEFVKG